MVSILDSIHRNAQAEDFNYLNSKRAALHQSQLKDSSLLDKITIRKNYCRELLFAGETTKAIHETEQLLKLLSPKGEISYSYKELYDLQAIAYLRLGEQENCLLKHSPQSCIVPIATAGVHQVQTGSRKAIKLYTQLLQAFPNDLQSRWLLNVAYMTLGEYPGKVPGPLLVPDTVFQSEYPLPYFKDVAAKVGLDINERSGGCSLEDFNKDGFMDVMVSSFGLNDQLRFFINNGEGTFMERTKEAGLSGIVSGLNMIHGDYNNDGNTDVLILRNSWLGKAGKIPNLLLRNNGDGTFDDVTIEAGLLSFYATQTASFADFNNDGWLDLFIGNEYGPEHPYPCELYVNNGDGTFTNIAKKFNLEVNEFVKGVVWGDINNDGLPDLYVSVLGGKNKLFLNKGGEDMDNWAFEDIASSAGVPQPFYSFPAWFWDYDNDGWQDIFVSGYSTRRYGQVGFDVAADYLGVPHKAELPKLYRNNGKNTFSDVTEQVGLNKVLYAMGANFGDFDNDGWLDCYLGTGAPDYMSIIPNRSFRNNNGKQFQDVTTSGGFGQIQKGHAVSFGDMDNDGDQDIYTVIGGYGEGDTYPNMLLENPHPSNAWTVLQLEGKESNRSAIGARIKVTTQDTLGKQRAIYATVSTGGSFGASSLQQEIGLGDVTKILQVEVKWPNAEKSISYFENLQVNNKYKLTEGAAQATKIPYKSFHLGGKNLPVNAHKPQSHAAHH